VISILGYCKIILISIYCGYRINAEREKGKLREREREREREKTIS